MGVGHLDKRKARNHFLTKYVKTFPCNISYSYTLSELLVSKSNHCSGWVGVCIVKKAKESQPPPPSPPPPPPTAAPPHSCSPGPGQRVPTK